MSTTVQLLFFGLLLSPAGGASYAEQLCLEALRREQHQAALRCVERLYQKTRDVRYLFSRSLFEEKAGAYWSQRGDASRACVHLDRSWRGFREYLRHPKATQANKKLLAGKLPRLKARIGYGRLELEILPVDAQVTLRRGQRSITRPSSVSLLCPGEYRLKIQHKGFRPMNLELRIRSRKVLRKTLRLRPLPRRPFRLPAWAWTLIGGGALAAGGGIVFLVAENKRQELQTRLDVDQNWKESMEQAQLFSYVSVGLFIGAGVVAGAALLMLSMERRSRSPQSARLRAKASVLSRGGW